MTTTELPRQLVPWAAQISEFLPDLALALAPWLQRLDLVIGPMRSIASPGDGEPDGFSGLTRRGPYERLLISEWLLASEVPEEFLRRAASGEHAFHELARREPAGDRTCVVLFDLGPSQLGAPRVAHLALLLVLWRRAQLAGADFRWARAQGGQLRERLDASSLSDLQLGQGAIAIDDETFAAWRDRPDMRHMKGEMWWIGGPDTARRAQRAGLPSVEIRDPFEPGQRLLVARVRPPGKLMAEVNLPLPSSDDCVRLLREPFRKVAPPAPKATTAPLRAPRGRVFDPAHRPFFCHNGRRLFVALRSGGVVIYAIPNSPNAPPAGTPVEHHVVPGDRVIAGAWLQNRPQLLVESKGLISQVDLGRKGGRVFTSQAFSSEPVDASTDNHDEEIERRSLQQIAAEVESWKRGDRRPSRPLPSRFGMLLTLPNSSQRYFLDERRRFLCVDSSAQKVTTVQTQVIGLAQSYHNVVVARGGSDQDKQTASILVYQGASKIVPAGEPFPVHGPRVFFGLGGLTHQYCPFAFERSEGEWVVLANPQKEYIHHVPDNMTVVGVHAISGTESPSLLVLADQGHRLHYFRDNQVTSEIIRMTSPIAQVTTSPTNAVVALLTTSGELCAFSLGYNKPVLRVFPGEEKSP